MTLTGSGAAPVTTAVRREDRAGFRRDLEGLRAVAILLVAVYHVWVGRVSGGVDVFLLVSGYFVGASVLTSFAEGRPPDLIRYYRRIFGRLLPPAALVLAACLVATWALTPSTRMTESSWQGLASLLYVENWYLATTGQAYGAADVSQSLTQHFWSLSVQGQLFLVLPLLLTAVSALLGARATHRTYVGAVSVLALASFGYATYLGAVDQPSAYYSTLARAWQFLGGTLLAVLLRSVASRRPSTASTAPRGVAGAVGLLVVLASGVVLDGGAQFPGPLASVPLAGAALVIFAGSQGEASGVTRFLGSRPLVVAGGYAYLFYLWHWPVLVLTVHLRDGRPPGVLAGAGVLVLSAVLSFLTARLFETTLQLPAAVRARLRVLDRGRPWTTRAVVGAVSVLVLVVGSSGWLLHVARERSSLTDVADVDRSVYPGALTRLDPGVWPSPSGVDPIPSPEVAQDDWAGHALGRCTAGRDDVEPRSCVLGDPDGTVSVALVGGSHTVNFSPPVLAVAESRGIRVDVYIKEGCPLKIEDDGSSCDVWSQAVIDAVVADRVDGVILTGTRPAELGDGIPDSYTVAWDHLFEARVPVVAIRDNPWMPFDGSECLAAGEDVCAVDRSDVLSDEDPLLRLAADDSLFFPLDFSDMFCDETTCDAVVGNIQVYMDSNHLTATFGRSMTAVVDARLGDATGWW